MEAKEKIYNAYLESRQDKLYFNQLKEYTNMSHSSLQNVLNKLTENGILKIDKTKSNVFYQIKNKKSFSLEFSKIALKKFEELGFEIKSPLKNFLKNIRKHPLALFLMRL